MSETPRKLDAVNLFFTECAVDAGLRTAESVTSFVARAHTVFEQTAENGKVHDDIWALFKIAAKAGNTNPHTALQWAFQAYLSMANADEARERRDQQMAERAAREATPDGADKAQARKRKAPAD